MIDLDRLRVGQRFTLHERGRRLHVQVERVKHTFLLVRTRDPESEDTERVRRVMRLTLDFARVKR